MDVRGRDIRAPENSDFVPFTPETRMSGIDYGLIKYVKVPQIQWRNLLKVMDVPFQSMLEK